ncbi:LPXTG cell wall anchor domain-containing protein [Streptomyces sp. NPDC052020]|uniref:LPXTG cell wall anchor domain-containing protein n=1 Tax=Streptomyces sp. NPDC052020 TaxID=3155677 RepID=UPI00342B227D
MAAAAATAVIAPAALLAAPAAYAAAGPSDASPSATGSESPTPTGDPSTSPAPSGSASDGPSAPSQTPSAPSQTPSSPAPTASESETTPAPSGSATPTSPAPTTTAPEESETPGPEPSICADSKVDVDIEGLPGKIAAGSGWHAFSLTVVNNSDSALEELDYIAGASSDEAGADLFSSKRVQLQAWDPEAGIWQDLNEDGHAIGYVGYSPELEAGHEVEIPLRINVTSKAPAGAGFSIGATVYGDTDGACTGFGRISYRFQIVAAGTDTGGERPAEGGRAPIAADKPKPAGTAPRVTGTLAATGSSSALPVIGLVGGVAVVAGAGAVFAVRRRKAGSEG